MKNNPPATRDLRAGSVSDRKRDPITPVAHAPGWRSVVLGWIRFWFTPVDVIGLHGLRFLAGLLFVFWLITLAGNQQALFSLSGWVDPRVYIEASRQQEPAGWSVLYLLNGGWLDAVYWGTIVLFVLFALGLWTRLTGVLTWVMVVSFSANPVIRAEADILLVILAFYLMIGYLLLGQWSRPLSAKERVLGPSDPWLLGRSETTPSYAANLALRLLQVHFALVVVVSGLHKLQIGDWWAGAAFWYPLHPPLETTAASIQKEAANGESVLFFLSLAQYLFLAWQLTFPLFAWRKAWRPLLLGGALVGWIGCLWIYRQPLFGPAYFLCCLSYLQPQEWQWLSGRVTGGLGWITGRLPQTVKPTSKA